MSRVKDWVLHFENVVHHRLVAHSVTVLRVATGAVFLCFGLLKFVPGVSPAESLTMATTHVLTFGLVPGGVSMVAIATLESVIGICLLAGRSMRLAIWLLAIQFVGILSPLVLLPGRLFAGPYHAPTLEGQYVLKDVILVGAGMVIAAATFRGGRMVRADLPPLSPRPRDAEPDAEQQLRIVLEGTGDPRRFAELSERYGISEGQLHDWRAIALAGAERALAEHDRERVPVVVPGSTCAVQRPPGGVHICGE
jgi:uncharacterized membrane protein YkgB